MRLADLASILAQGCTLWTDSFKLSGTPARSGGFRFYKKTGPGFSPGPDELWISQVKSSNRFAVNRLRGLRSGSKTQIAEYSQF